ncbi:hypothetical protein [Streptomyces sp. NPDC088789]|uniref:hypothetical protein n=1 Tax=Streptomyces sp. NPDC088789 TaxID=3365899 RepID=UPI003804BCBA
MRQDEILSDLTVSGGASAPERLAALADEFDLPVADLLVVAGRPVPAELLPPPRDAGTVRAFAYRVSHCDHTQLASLEDFVRTLPHVSVPRVTVPEPVVPSVSPYHPPVGTGFAAVLDGLLRNRGFDVRDLPFLGLSRSTLYGMLSRWEPSRHRQFQLRAIAGPLGWTLPDLFAVAGEPYGEGLRPVVLCRHVGRVFLASRFLTTGQLVEAAREADRLSARERHGAWQPVSQGFAAQCPDFHRPRDGVTTPLPAPPAPTSDTSRRSTPGT